MGKQETTFQYPKWNYGPKHLGLFFTTLNEIKRYKEGKPSRFYTFPKGDPLPNVSLHEVKKVLNSIPLDTEFDDTRYDE